MRVQAARAVATAQQYISTSEQMARLKHARTQDLPCDMCARLYVILCLPCLYFALRFLGLSYCTA